MSKHRSGETDEREDELELHDEELKKQIADGYQTYLRGETQDLNTLIGEMRNDLNSQKAKRAMRRCDASSNFLLSFKRTPLADTSQTAG